nr:[NiFe]-hydrogenase assembly chaperone HybE [Azospirillum halopraeferens]
MKGLPVCNSALSVEAVEFHPYGDAMLGALITPWTLNVVLLPNDPARYESLNDGDKVSEVMPSATYGFTIARLGALGAIAAIPAVSDMTVLRDRNDAVAAAVAALKTVLTPRPPEPPAAPEPEPASAPAAERSGGVSRRSLFRGRRA